MPRAQLKSQLPTNADIDVENGVIRGCKLMLVNTTATFADANGKAKSIEVTPDLIKGMIGHAGNRSIPAHLSHDWTDSKADAIHARLGVVKNIRTDDLGNLIGDFHTQPGEARNTALWYAKEAPEAAMFSTIFNYNPVERDGKTYAVPLDFISADLVAQGACTRAMFSANQNNDMTKEETVALINESVPKLVTDAVTAALKDFKPAKSIDEAGVTSIVTAALKEHKPTIDEEALLVKAEARFASKIGTHGHNLGLGTGGGNGDKLPFLALLSSHEAICKDRGKAILRAKTDNPKAYNEWVEAGRPEPQLAKA